MKQMSLRAKVAVAVSLPLIAFIAFASYDSWIASKQASEEGGPARLVRLSTYAGHLSNAVHVMQVERGLTAGFYGNSSDENRNKLRDHRKTVDATLDKLWSYEDESGIVEAFSDIDARDGYPRDIFTTSRNAWKARLDTLSDHRKKIDSQSIKLGEALSFYTANHALMLDQIGMIPVFLDMPELDRETASFAFLLQAKERMGIERAVLANTFAADAFAPGNAAKLRGLITTQDNFIKAFKLTASAAMAKRVETLLASEASKKVESYRSTAFDKEATGAFGVEASEWFKTITEKIVATKALEDDMAEMLAARATQIQQDASSKFSFILIVSVVVLLAVLASSYGLIRSLTKALSGSATSLRTISDDVETRATEMANSASSLADGASAQAASIEETSASINETSSQAGRAASYAKSASEGMKAVSLSVESARNLVASLQNAMGKISESADKTKGIVNAIEEIAFQTNLLALNAAVEAARAGEAGKGFAVVAEEVRNLAQRSSASASDATRLVEESVKAVLSGNSGVTELVETLDEAGRLTQAADEQIGQVDNASIEQSAALSQMSTAVQRLEDTAQNNAAISEETSSSCSELDALSKQMMRIVREFEAIINGG